MLWYKSVSLLLLKRVRTVTVPLLQAEKKKSETAVFKISSVSSLCEGFLNVFLSGPSFSSLSIETIWGDLPFMICCCEGNIKQLVAVLWGVWPLGKWREILGYIGDGEEGVSLKDQRSLCALSCGLLECLLG